MTITQWRIEPVRRESWMLKNINRGRSKRQIRITKVGLDYEDERLLDDELEN